MIQHFLDRLDLRYTFPTYTDLQSLVKCLDHRGIVLVLDTVCSQAKVVLSCATHLNALKCISEANTGTIIQHSPS
jgi:hypothetical protein